MACSGEVDFHSDGQGLFFDLVVLFDDGFLIASQAFIDFVGDLAVAVIQIIARTGLVRIIAVKGGSGVKIYDYQGKKNVSGARIREARLKRRLTQADFAAQLQIAGITIERDSVSRIEIGTRFVADFELKVIAKVLNVSVDWLLSEY